MRFTPFMAVLFSGATWLSVGVFLMNKGLSLLAVPAEKSSSLVRWLSSMAGSLEQAILILICLGLFIGFMKGRYVLSKTVMRMTDRFYSFEGKIQWSKLYPLSYALLIVMMVGLGISMRWLPIAQEVRGFVDIAIGAALIQGAVLYFRQAFQRGKQKVKST